MTNSIATIIKNLIGDDMDSTLVSGYNDFIISGFNYIADIIPAHSELWSASNLPNTGRASNSTMNLNEDNITRKVIMVTRKQSGDVDRKAKEVSYSNYLRGVDTSSIYYHGKSVRSPIYTIKPDGDLQISPSVESTDERIVYYFQYITADISARTDFDSTATATTGAGFPNDAIMAGCIKSALNLLQSKISDASQDEEDQELLSLLQAQVGTLSQQLQEEVTRLGLPYKVIGVKDDVE